MSAETRIEETLDFIFQTGCVDGDHHKQWIIDQIVRGLIEDADDYEAWVKKYQDGEDGPNTYEWDVGVPP